MKKLYGMFVLGLVASVVGWGDDDNPVKFNQDLLVGTWLGELWSNSGDVTTFKANGRFSTYYSGDDNAGDWSLVGD